MSARISEDRPLVSQAACLLSGCTFALLLQAATPQPVLLELDEVQIAAKVPWPLEDYLESPQFDNVVISPGSTHLAVGWGSRLNIIDLPSLKPHSSGRLQLVSGVADVRWVDENRLVIQTDWPLRGLRRMREPAGSLIVTDLEGQTVRHLFPAPQPLGVSMPEMTRDLNPDGTTHFEITRLHPDPDLFGILRIGEEVARQTGAGRGPLAFGPVKLVAPRTSTPEQLLFQTWWTDTDRKGFGVFALDLAECREVRMASLPLRGGEVITGPDQRPAVVAGVNEAGEWMVYFLPEVARDSGEDWKLLVKSGSGERGLLPLAWTGQDEKYFALDGRGLATRAVVIWDADKNTRQILYQHHDADMDAAWLDPSGKPWMFSGISQYPIYWYPDVDHPLAQLHRDLVRQLPREKVDIVNASDDLTTAVVRISSGARPTLFLVVDVKTGKSLTGMYAYPKLRGRRISPVEAFEFTARDGLAIRGYLTTPLDERGVVRSNAPLLVIAHDGPAGEFPDYRYTADSSYDFERQLFASRGYAVLQVNVRGTGGRGTEFQQAGDGEWGRAVQDDYADAVRWAIEKGVAAAGRVCFYGTGYGAYSALMAAAREPDLFQCVVGVGGVYDLPRMVTDGTRQETGDMDGFVPVNKKSKCYDMETEIAKEVILTRSPSRQEKRKALEVLNGTLVSNGIPTRLQRAVGNDLQLLKARSPVSYASKIKARVLLVHQFRDAQVPKDQLTAMQSALRSAGKAVQTDTIGDESNGNNDGYFTAQTRTDAYRSFLEFLKKQIGD